MTVTETLLRTVVLRLGGLLVLMLAVGYWSDVLHVLIAFLGEGVCLLPAQDLLQAAVKVLSLLDCNSYIVGYFT